MSVFCMKNDDGVITAHDCDDDTPCRLPDGRIVLFEDVPPKIDCERHGPFGWQKGWRVVLDLKKRCLGCGSRPGGSQESMLCGPCYNMGIRSFHDGVVKMPEFGDASEYSSDLQDHLVRIGKYQCYLTIQKELGL